MAFTLVGFVLICTGLGYLVDRWVGTRPWLMVAGVFVGAALGFVYLASFLFSGPAGSRDRKKTGTDGEEPDGRLS